MIFDITHSIISRFQQKQPNSAIFPDAKKQFSANAF